MIVGVLRAEEKKLNVWKLYTLITQSFNVWQFDTVDNNDVTKNFFYHLFLLYFLLSKNQPGSNPQISKLTIIHTYCKNNEKIK